MHCIICICMQILIHHMVSEAPILEKRCILIKSTRTLHELFVGRWSETISVLGVSVSQLQAQLPVVAVNTGGPLESIVDNVAWPIEQLVQQRVWDLVLHPLWPRLIELHGLEILQLWTHCQTTTSLCVVSLQETGYLRPQEPKAWAMGFFHVFPGYKPTSCIWARVKRWYEGAFM